MGFSTQRVLPYSAHAVSPCPPLTSSLHTSHTPCTEHSLPAAFCMLLCKKGSFLPPPGSVSAFLQDCSGDTSFRKLSLLDLLHHLSKPQTVLSTVLRVSFRTLCIKIVHFNR